MKKLLSLIAGATLLAFGSAGDAVAFPSFGSPPSSLFTRSNDRIIKTTSPLNTYGRLRTRPTFPARLPVTSPNVNSIQQAILTPPSSGGFSVAGAFGEEANNNNGRGFCLEGCCLKVGCAMNAVGGLFKATSLAAQCGSSSTLKSAANCVQQKNEDAYYALLSKNCISGCDIASAETKKKFACDKDKSIVANQSLLTLPTTLSQGQTESLEISLLSQG